MAQCMGTLGGPCPNKKSGSDVERQGEIWLCSSCQQARSENSESAHTELENLDGILHENANAIIDPVLAYIVFAQQSGTQENIMKAVLAAISAGANLARQRRFVGKMRHEYNRRESKTQGFEQEASQGGTCQRPCWCTDEAGLGGQDAGSVD